MVCYSVVLLLVEAALLVVEVLRSVVNQPVLL